MGGWGSGRYGGRPTADASLRIDLAWMLRTGRAKEGAHQRGALNWTCGGEPSGSIRYDAIMHEPGGERLELSYARGSGEDREQVRQTIRLCHTRPNYGGKRWWMICPYRHIRVGKLYLPPGGDRFASRHAWRLGYQCQRDSARDRPFERLSRLQKKLGCDPGWEAGLYRPKGMWNRTFERHLERYWELDEQCALEMMAVMGRLGR
ncbi:hypothetical protein [Sphingopyxis witflariensis]|uniref:Uncharacterized protein n=1 Tax=Sphingopyxis witflariensis TaxID=173675 RepID=A0A246JQS4_9SPHN|nr:hypothetical protein [Sphingopyxis witflariensis]OWQ95360.1 hypothetical protein CDQ91_13840 [Sphingopyxis witflariensis]